METSTTSPYTTILRTHNFIANQWISEGAGQMDVLDKYTNQVIATLPEATEAQMEQAIQAAQSGFEALKTWSAGKRQDALNKLADLLEEQQDAWADLIVKEAGKPLGYAKGEIARCLITIRTAAAEAVRFSGEMVPIDFAAGEGKTAFTKRFPVGIVGCITPFNFPLNLLLHKVAPALATGSSVVIKPAPQSPLCTHAFAELMLEAGFPKGVYNVLTCSIPVAEKLVRDERVGMLSFTGSDAVGWHLKNIAGRKKVALELGGNAAVIIDATADLKKAAKLCAVGSYIYAGQVCISTQRIFVDEAVFDQFKAMLIAEIEALKVGDPNDSDTLVGPIIDSSHLDRITEWVNEAVAAGAEVLTGGHIVSRDNNVYAPTLLTNTTSAMKVCSREAFGPVCVLEKVTDFEAGISKANDSDFGLQVGIFTNRFDQVKAAHETLEVGGIMVNNIPGFRVDSMPYGGIKGSGFGREGIKYAMEEMTEPRLLVY